MGKLIRVALGLVLLYACAVNALQAAKLKPFLEPELVTDGSIMERATSAMKVQLGRKEMNGAFFKKAIFAVIAGAASLIVLSYRKPQPRKRYAPSVRGRSVRNAYRRETEQLRQTQDRFMKPRADFSGYGEYVVGFDTNVLLDMPELLDEAAETNRLVIAKQVVAELEGMKKDAALGRKASKAFYHLDKLQAAGRLSIVRENREQMERHDLDPNEPDQRIIGAYLAEKNRTGGSLLFVSKDRGAKLYARDAGIAVYEAKL